MKKEVLLFSGGIDSFVAWFFLNQPQTVYFNTGSRYAAQEQRVVLSILPDTIIDKSLDFSQREQESAYIPFRNLLFAAQAVKYADTIYIAGLMDDVASDKNEAIFKEFSMLLSKLEGREINVLSPFWHMSKSDVVGWFLQHHSDKKDWLLETVSCYSGSSGYCGACASCFRKWVAFRHNGIELDFYDEAILEMYYQRAKEGKYINERNNTIIYEIEKYRNRH